MTAPDTLRVAMGQILVEGGKPTENLGRALAAIDAAAARGCQAIVLPECLDLGWTDPSARDQAQPIPGPHSAALASAARRHGLLVAAGLVERAGEKRFNAAVLLAPDGRMLLHHRKINELDIAHDLYAIGDRLAVAETAFGIAGIDICADNFPSSLAIGHVLARMGARVIFSPSAWAMPAEHDNAAEPYGALWTGAYTALARLYGVAVIGVSNVGWIGSGPWRGRKAIGCSLAVGPGGEVLARGPYGVDAEALVVVDLPLRPPPARGTQFAEHLRKMGYEGP